MILSSRQEMIYGQESYEVWHSLPAQQTEPIKEGIIQELTERPSKDRLIPVFAGGVSGSKKTTATWQFLTELWKDPTIVNFQRKHHMRMRVYSLDMGRGLKKCRDLGIIKSPQGEITNREYDGFSDYTETIFVLGLEHLQGPGIAHGEFVFVTGDTEGRGVQRGSIRLLKRSVVNSNARLLVYATPEDLKDEMGEDRTKFRNADESEIKQLTRKAGVIHSAQSPKAIQDHYRLYSSNETTRVQQTRDVALLTWYELPADEKRRFGSFKEYYQYYVVDHREKWERIAFNHYKEWMGSIFDKPYDIIPSQYGQLFWAKAIEKDQEEGEDQLLTKPVIHLYDAEIAAADMMKALQIEAERTRSHSLKIALRGLELCHQTIYALGQIP